MTSVAAKASRSVHFHLKSKKVPGCAKRIVGLRRQQGFRVHGDDLTCSKSEGNESDRLTRLHRYAGRQAQQIRKMTGHVRA